MTADQEQLLMEWEKYTTGANAHNMGRIRCAFVIYAGEAHKCYDWLVNKEHAETTEKQMRGILAQLKLASLNGTFYRVP